MRVLHNRPHAWFLLEDGNELILDVNCNYSFVGYSFAMLLNQRERNRFREEGTEFIDDLADQINQSAPIAIASTSKFKSRKVEDSFTEQISAAIAIWNAQNN